MDSTNLSTRKNKGVITIYCALIFMLIISFIFSIIDFARINAAKNQAIIAADNALESGMSQYDRGLYKDYGIYAVDNSSSVINEINDIFKKNITVDDEQTHDFVDLLNIYGTTSNVSFSNNPFIQNEIMKRQMCYAMKYDGVSNLFEEVLDTTGVLDKIQELLGSSDKLKSANDFNDMNTLMEKLQKQIDKVEDGKTEILKMSYNVLYNTPTDESYPKYFAGTGDYILSDDLISSNPLGEYAAKCVAYITEVNIHYHNYLAYNYGRFLFISYSNEIVKEKEELESESQSLATEKTSLITEKDNLETEKAQVNSEIDRLNDEIDDLNDDINDIDDEIEALDPQSPTYETDKQNLIDQKTAKQNEINAKNGQISSKNQRKTIIETREGQIATSVSQIDARVDEINDRIADIEAEVEILTTTDTNLKAAADGALDDYCSMLQDYTDTFTEAINALNKLINEYGDTRHKVKNYLDECTFDQSPDLQRFKQSYYMYVEDDYLIKTKSIFELTRNFLQSGMYDVKNNLDSKINGDNGLINQIKNNNTNKIDGSARNKVDELVNSMLASAESYGYRNYPVDSIVNEPTKQFIESNYSEIINYGSSGNHWFNYYRKALLDLDHITLDNFVSSSADVIWEVLDIGLKVKTTEKAKEVFNFFKDATGTGSGGIIDIMLNKYDSTNAATSTMLQNLPHQTAGGAVTNIPVIYDINGEQMDIIEALMKPELVADEYKSALNEITDEGAVQTFIEALLNIEIPDNWSLEGLAGDFIDKLFMEEYAMTYFKSMVDPVRRRIPAETEASTVLEYEIESIIGTGLTKYDDTNNKIDVASQLFTLRYLCNAVYFFCMDRDMQETADALGQIIAAAVSWIPGVNIALNPYTVATVIKIGWIYIETRKDFLDLMNGYEVPIMKNDTTWMTQFNGRVDVEVIDTDDYQSLTVSVTTFEDSLDSIETDDIVNSNENVDAPNNNQNSGLLSINYTDYLRLRMLLMSEESLVDGTQNLICLNKQLSDGTFNYSSYATSGSIDVNVGMSRWFNTSVYNGGANEVNHSFNSLTRTRTYN